MNRASPVLQIKKDSLMVIVDQNVTNSKVKVVGQVRAKDQTVASLRREFSLMESVVNAQITQSQHRKVLKLILLMKKAPNYSKHVSLYSQQGQEMLQHADLMYAFPNINS